MDELFERNHSHEDVNYCLSFGVHFGTFRTLSLTDLTAPTVEMQIFRTFIVNIIYYENSIQNQISKFASKLSVMLRSGKGNVLASLKCTCTVIQYLTSSNAQYTSLHFKIHVEYKCKWLLQSILYT